MDFQKVFQNFLKVKAKNVPEVVEEANNFLRRSGHEEYEVVLVNNEKIVLLDTSKDVSVGAVIKDNKIVDFNNTPDLQAVTVDSYARYNILRLISNGEDLEKMKKLFNKKRTWIIHCVRNEDSFEAHTHGLDAYSHPDFRIKTDIGDEEIAYLLNSLSKSIQRGNSFRDGDIIENLYENCNIRLEKSKDGFFDVNLQSR